MRIRALPWRHSLEICNIDANVALNDEWPTRSRSWRRRLWGDGGLKTTRYFEQQVLRKRPYIDRAWCEAAMAAPIRSETQADGRVRFWIDVTLAGEDEPHVLRVVTLADGETVHNAFLDRNFRKDA